MKAMYVTPLMECTSIEAEGTFAGSKVHDDGKGAAVKTVDQDYHSFEWNDATEGLDSEKNQGKITWE